MVKGSPLLVVDLISSLSSKEPSEALTTDRLDLSDSMTHGLFFSFSRSVQFLFRSCLKANLGSGIIMILKK